ncbi:ornithine carbamoyltransferase [Neoconidiobolus thromboides FSU 785]|nr:ornithine carbamoyltransferase [Neoconidiobolus thromboides FSU 785]
MFLKSIQSKAFQSLKYKTGIRSYSNKITSFETLKDLNANQINHLIKTSIKFKKDIKNNVTSYDQTLRSKSIALLFSKRSTRTRLATETSANLLGAKTFYLGANDIQLNVNETLLDSAKVISSMVDCIVARVGSHSEIEELMKYSSVPVVNALSDKYHPTQILADLMTLHETYCQEMNIQKAEDTDLFHTLGGKKVTWIGDVNNVLYSLMLTLPKFKIHLSISSPKGYEPLKEILLIANNEASRSGANLEILNDPIEAIKNSNVIVTDTWVSMGQEEEFDKRILDFKGYQVTMDLISKSKANPDWKFLHCLPRKPYEVDDEVFYSNRSLVFQEAENRKWTIMAVLYSLMHLKHFPEA